MSDDPIKKLKALRSAQEVAQAEAEQRAAEAGKLMAAEANAVLAIYEPIFKREEAKDPDAVHVLVIPAGVVPIIKLTLDTPVGEYSVTVDRSLSDRDGNPAVYQVRWSKPRGIYHEDPLQVASNALTQLRNDPTLAERNVITALTEVLSDVQKRIEKERERRR